MRSMLMPRRSRQYYDSPFPTTNGDGPSSSEPLGRHGAKGGVDEVNAGEGAVVVTQPS